jgi:hypothetical protein
LVGEDDVLAEDLAGNTSHVVGLAGWTIHRKSFSTKHQKSANLRVKNQRVRAN